MPRFMQNKQNLNYDCTRENAKNALKTFKRQLNT